MKKKSDKVEKEVERDEDEDEEDANGADDSDESEEEQDRPAAAARSVADERRARRAAAARAPKKTDAHDDHGHGHDHDDEDSNEGEDPTWWAPHAVMSALVLIGVLGFFGLFNKILAPIAAHPAGHGEPAKEETKTLETAKAPPPAQSKSAPIAVLICFG